MSPFKYVLFHMTLSENLMNCKKLGMLVRKHAGDLVTCMACGVDLLVGGGWVWLSIEVAGAFGLVVDPDDADGVGTWL